MKKLTKQSNSKLSEAEKLCFRQAMQELNVKPLKNNNDEKVVIQVKEKKVYLTGNKNDMYQKGSVDYLRNQIIKSTLFPSETTSG